MACTLYVHEAIGINLGPSAQDHWCQVFKLRITAAMFASLGSLLPAFTSRITVAMLTCWIKSPMFHTEVSEEAQETHAGIPEPECSGAPWFVCYRLFSIG